MTKNEKDQHHHHDEQADDHKMDHSEHVGHSYHEDQVEEGFFEERRGKGSTGRPSTKDLSAEKKLEKAEARIKYLEAENELLKKLEELERQAKKRS